MSGYHMMHQAARRNAFPGKLENGIDKVLMFVVRYIFSKSGRLEEAIAAPAAAGKVPN